MELNTQMLPENVKMTVIRLVGFDDMVQHLPQLEAIADATMDVLEGSDEEFIELQVTLLTKVKL